ncbi:MAG: hypothetical protein GYA87_02815 [Christensenellaceae bacterium]|nr:hypothetical protein [Christensenellaceae bacterium]
MKTVKIKLFKDDEKYSGDVFACLNGKSYLIQRGVEVEVPYPLAAIIERSAQADIQTYKNLNNLMQKYKRGI